MEIRTQTLPTQNTHDGNTLTGYAAMFNSPTIIDNRFEERIAPGAFTRAIQENDILALWAHKQDEVLGRTKSGTLTLSEDAKGLKFSLTLPNSRTELKELIQRGDVNGLSFGWAEYDDEWNYRGKMPQCLLTRINLKEISLTPLPAYPSTSMQLRSSNLWKIQNDFRRILIPKE